MSAEIDKTYEVSAYSDPVVLRVNGRASLHNASQVNDFFRRMIKRGVARFIVDFRECSGMDSTFLGILAGTALDVREKSGGEGYFILTNLNERNHELIKNLGLHLIADVVKGESEKLKGADVSPEALSDTGSADTERDKAKMILRAHQDLVRVDSTNKERFQDVIAFLKNQIDESK